MVDWCSFRVRSRVSSKMHRSYSNGEANACQCPSPPPPPCWRLDDPNADVAAAHKIDFDRHPLCYLAERGPSGGERL